MAIDTLVQGGPGLEDLQNVGVLAPLVADLIVYDLRDIKPNFSSEPSQNTIKNGIEYKV